MKFENFLRQSNGNEVEAAKALFKALRDERGIHLRYEALPHLFDIGQNENQQTGLKGQPHLMRHYAITNNLRHPEEIIDHLNINNINVSCGNYLKSHPIGANSVDAKRTIRDLQKRKIIGQEENVYQLVEDYFSYLSTNGVNLTNSKFEETLNQKLTNELKSLEKIADLVVKFGIYITLCPPGWTDTHLDYTRILVGQKWHDDRGRIAEKKLKEAAHSKGYLKMSHGLCDECQKAYENIRG